MSRSGDGKRNFLWGWPQDNCNVNVVLLKENQQHACLHVMFSKNFLLKIHEKMSCGNIIKLITTVGKYFDMVLILKLSIYELST